MTPGSFSIDVAVETAEDNQEEVLSLINLAITVGQLPNFGYVSLTTPVAATACVDPELSVEEQLSSINAKGRLTFLHTNDVRDRIGKRFAGHMDSI